MSDQEKLSENEEIKKISQEEAEELNNPKDASKETDAVSEKTTEPEEISTEDTDKEISSDVEKEELDIPEEKDLAVPEKISEEKKEIPIEETPEKEIATTDAPEAEETPEKEVATSDAPEAEETDEEEVSSSDDEEKEEDDESHDNLENSKKDYHAMTKTQLVAALKELVQTKPVQEIKNQVEEIKNEFNNQFDEELAEKKEEFLAQGGNIIDFQYTSPIKQDFNTAYFEYKEKRNSHYKKLKNDLQANLKKRLDLIEELKGLIDVEENINTTYKHFKDIQVRWREAGPIPRDGYNTVWNTYHHHVENFYDFLHLNREFRDMDFKHNLEQKLKIIARAEELAQEENLNRAFRELQMLHKMWKEDTGPVAKEYRDDVWDKFSAATKIIHDKRALLQKELEKDFEVNLEKKNELVAQIKALSETTKDSHQAWQNSIKTLEKLRQDFFNTGKVPTKNNEESWSSFKDAVNTFNKKKNHFYKSQKKEQFTNLAKKQDLIKIAEENKDSEDFDVVTPLMKKIQNEWKNIGHVPRKDSDKVWKKFKAACNHYFDRVNAERNEANKGEQEAFEKKTALMEELNTFELSGDTKKDLNSIKSKIAEWKEIGRVPFNKKNIDGKFNKIIDALFKKLDMSKKEVELLKYDNKLNSISSHDDERKMQNERFFITKKIDEVKAELNQLENNLGFFQHVDDKNPLVREVHNNIQRHKDELELWKEKLKKLKEVM